MGAQVGGTFWLTRLSRDREAAVRVAALTLLAHLASNKAPATRRMLLQGWPEAGTAVLKVCLLSGHVLSNPRLLGNVACACCWAACACVPYLNRVALQKRLGCIARCKGRVAVPKGLKDHPVLGHAVTSYQRLAIEVQCQQLPVCCTEVCTGKHDHGPVYRLQKYLIA